MYAIKQIIEEPNKVFWLKKNGEFEKGCFNLQLFLEEEFAELEVRRRTEELSCGFGIYGIQYQAVKISLEAVWNKEENTFVLQGKNEC